MGFDGCGAAGAFAFGDDDDAAFLAAGSSHVESSPDLAEVHGRFGDDDFLGAAADAGVEGDVSGGVSHDFDDEEAGVRGGGVADLVDCVEGGVDRGVEADGVVGAVEVVVDGAGDADALDAVLEDEFVEAVERAVPADDDEAVDVAFLDGLVRLLSSFRGEEAWAACGLDDGAAVFDDVADGGGGEWFHVVVDEAFVAAFDAVDGVSEIQRGADDGAQGCVHAGGVAAAGEDTDGLGFDFSPRSLVVWDW